MTTCDRLWEVEAARDGRLPDRDRGRALEHQSTCEVCGAERASLEQLADDLRASRPSTDDLALRRVRNAVLARVARPVAPRASRRWIGAATAAAMAMGIGLAGWATLHDPGGATASPDGVVIEAQEGGLASHVQSGSEDRVLLSEGRFAVDVRRHAPGRRLVFALPDGELEDWGTRFEVNVRGGRTIGVVVHEGAVVLRRTGQAEVHLGAGAAWSLPVDAPTASGSGESSATAAPAPTQVAEATPTSTASTMAAPIGAPTPPPTACAAPRTMPAPALPAPAVPSPEAARTARAPTTAGGLAPTAAAPAPSRAEARSVEEKALEEKALEDDAYLRVVALLREGRHEEARVAARSYLRRFPEGLRRTELAAIAR